MRVLTVRRARVLRSLVLGLPFVAILLGESEVLVAIRQLYAVRAAGVLDVAQTHDRRFAPLRGVLPEYGVIGYYDPDQSADEPSVRAFYLAQYALAPRVLIISAAPEIVVYSSHTGRALDPASLPRGLRVFSQIQPDLAVLIRLPR